jgi:hypothetical protein
MTRVGFGPLCTSRVTIISLRRVEGGLCNVNRVRRRRGKEKGRARQVCKHLCMLNVLYKRAAHISELRIYASCALSSDFRTFRANTTTNS